MQFQTTPRPFCTKEVLLASSGFLALLTTILGLVYSRAVADEATFRWFGMQQLCWQFLLLHEFPLWRITLRPGIAFYRIGLFLMFALGLSSLFGIALSVTTTTTLGSLYLSLASSTFSLLFVSLLYGKWRKKC